MKNEALQHFRALMPFLAGRLTLAEFTFFALAVLDLDPDARPQPDPFEPPAFWDPGPNNVHLVLEEEGGNVSATARRMHVATKTVYRWLQKTGRSPGEFRTPPEDSFCAAP